MKRAITSSHTFRESSRMTRMSGLISKGHSDNASVYDIVDSGLLVARTSDDVLVIRRYVATEHRRGFLRL